MRKQIPTGSQVIACAEKFKRWLSDRGAEVLAPTNDYEIIRFKTGKGTAIVYRRKEENYPVTFTGDAQQAWFEYIKPNGSQWRAIPATKRKSHDNTIYQTLRQRDGDGCFYCAQYMQESEATIEHLVAITHGGPQHISNKFLAHSECNSKAGNLSVVQKIQIYHFSRMKQYQKAVHNEQRRQDRAASVAHPGETGDTTWGVPIATG